MTTSKEQKDKFLESNIEIKIELIDIFGACGAKTYH
jgi:hypothetical protein